MATIARMYSDDQGGSHFDELPLTIHAAEGEKFNDTHRWESPSVFLRAFSAGAELPAHTVPSRQFVVVLRGSIEMQTSDGQIRKFEPGDLMFAEDLSGDGHSSHAVQDVVTLHVYVGETFHLEGVLQTVAKINSKV